LVGPADEAILFTGTRAAPTIAANVQNTKPATFSPSETYKAGDVVLNGGTMPSVASFLDGTQNVMFVSVRDDNTGHTPGMAGEHWWARFVPYDGNNGPGGRIRLADAAVNGQPLAAAGKVYGPYLDPERFKMNGTVLLDRYGSPILYFPVNKAANPRLNLTAPAVSTGWSMVLAYPPATGTQSQVNLADNLGAFVNPQGVPSEATDTIPAQTRIRVIMGDYGANGYFETGTDAEIQPLPFLLWTAGADKTFGPRGNGVAAAAGWKLNDVITGGMNTDQNRLSAAACDDVTNFR
jgi:hypothetical protein